MIGSSALHVASLEEIDRLWPSLRVARAFPSHEELRRFHEEAPWRLMVGKSGRAVLLDRWRRQSPILAIRGLWCAEHEVKDVVRQCRDVAATHGFDTLLSPLVTESVSRPYASAGMTPLVRLVVLRARPRDLADKQTPSLPGTRIRFACHADIPDLIRLDDACFDEFWRYGPSEMAEYMAVQRLVVAQSAEGIVGYTLATIDGGTGTLGRLAVEPPYRRRGVGSALLADAFGWMARTGVSAVSLCTQETNAASRALYANAGLKEQHERLVFLTRDTGRAKRAHAQEAP